MSDKETVGKRQRHNDNEQQGGDPPRKRQATESEDDDDSDDMFAVSDDNDEDQSCRPVPKHRSTGKKPPPMTMVDNIDDADGYYKIIVGDMVNGRYEIISQLGRGMFGSVIKATDTVKNQTVAVKVLRNNETIFKAGQHEVSMFEKVQALNHKSNNNTHVIELLSSFHYRNHLCLVFQEMHLNLRQVIKKFGYNVGLNINAVQSYTRQMLVGLDALHHCQILHCDIKPDNILVSHNHTLVKICDLGSSLDMTTTTTTPPEPYLVSRFYRAPELILGSGPANYPIDMWSLACTVYELYTGTILFPGKNNNHMLKLILQTRGRPPAKMIKRSKYAHLYFTNPSENPSIAPFIDSSYKDPVTDKFTTRHINLPQPSQSIPGNDFKSLLLPNNNSIPSPLLLPFIDFLNSALNVNPDKRLTLSQALHHPFLLQKGNT